MKSTCKRLISFLLMMVLLLGMPFSAMATETEEPTEGETLPESWQIISDSLPDTVEGIDPLDPDNPYPYGEPVDNFFPEGLLEPDPYGVSLMADQGSIPDEMWDNAILRALEYTGYDVQTLKDKGWLYSAQYISGSLKTNAPQILSDIGYYESGACPNGDETVADSSTVTGRAPKISYFESNGMVCASFVTYYLCNYLPNIEGVDTSHIYSKAKTMGADSQYPNVYYLTTVTLWRNVLDSLASTSGAGVTKYTNANTAYKNLVPGDVIVFARDGALTHIGIYAGEHNLYSYGSNMGKYHFLIHVGNARGPEISTVEYMANAGAKSSEPIAWYHLDINDDVQQTGYIEVNKMDPNGKNLAGACFVATDQATGTEYYIGPTNASGYAKSGELPLGTYKVVETVFPEGYEPSGQTSWTVTLTKDTPNMTITINAVNKQTTGVGRIIKKTNTGQDLGGRRFNIYSDSALTKPVAGSPFTTSASGVIDVELVPGDYWVKEVDESAKYPYWKFDSNVKKVTVKANETASVTFENVHNGRLKIIKNMPDGGSVAGWVFDVYRVSDGAHIGAFTSGADGTITTGNLLPGEYRIQERIPDGSLYVCETENPQTVVVEPGKTASVTFSNRLRPAELIIYKVDTLGAPLAEVEFLLECSADGTAWAPVIFTDSLDVTEGTCTSAGLTDGKLSSGRDGVVCFTGLHPDRIYRLTETKAPEGYQLLTGPAYEGKISAEETLVVELTVVNAPVYELPMTGSIGSTVRTILQIAGAAMLLGALLLIAKKRR